MSLRNDRFSRGLADRESKRETSDESVGVPRIDVHGHVEREGDRAVRVSLYDEVHDIDENGIVTIGAHRYQLLVFEERDTLVVI